MNINNKTSKLTFLGVMLALTVVFVMITAIPGTAATMAVFMFIPAIVTGIIYGPKLGALMGFMAGLITLIRAYVAPLSPFDYFFQNPIIAIVPRIFIGIVPYYIYKLFTKLIPKVESIGLALAGAFGAITNTILVVTVLYFLFGKTIVTDFGYASSYIAFFIGICGVNGIIEAVTAAILTIPIVKIYKKMSTH